MKVFISQPMKNKSDEEILNERNRAIELLKNNNSNIWNIYLFLFNFNHNIKLSKYKEIIYHYKYLI